MKFSFLVLMYNYLKFPILDCTALQNVFLTHSEKKQFIFDLVWVFGKPSVYERVIFLLVNL